MCVSAVNSRFGRLLLVRRTQLVVAGNLPYTFNPHLTAGGGITSLPAYGPKLEAAGHHTRGASRYGTSLTRRGRRIHALLNADQIRYLTHYPRVQSGKQESSREDSFGCIGRSLGAEWSGHVCFLVRNRSFLGVDGGGFRHLSARGNEDGLRCGRVGPARRRGSGGRRRPARTASRHRAPLKASSHAAQKRPPGLFDRRRNRHR